MERLIWRGRGLARLDNGQVVLLEPGVFPGERIKAKVTKAAKDYIRAQCTEILEPSNTRRGHPCSLSHQCGGCRFGVLPYLEQLNHKHRILISEMRRSLGKKWAGHAPWEAAIHPSPARWRYRWRGQVQVREGAAHFQALGSRDLVPFRDCLLFSRPLSRGIQKLLPSLEPGRWTVAASPMDGTARTRGSQDWIPLPLKDYGVTLKIPPASFFQANWDLNRELVGFVQTRVADLKRVADIYAGGGNFALPCAAAGNQVLALEGDPEAVKGARMAARDANLENICIQEMQLGRENPARTLEDFAPQGLILDPPRAGGGKRLHGLGSLPDLKRLVWISCDVVNTCRDLIPFLEGGWRIRETALFDMFPQTWHMEAVLILER